MGSFDSLDPLGGLGGDFKEDRGPASWDSRFVQTVHPCPLTDWGLLGNKGICYVGLIFIGVLSP